MTLSIVYADCMASPPASNPYGQLPQKLLSTALNKAHYTDDQPVASGRQHQQQQQQQQEHMPHDGTPERSFTHSSSLFSSYDGLSGGMASDSELTTSATTRHHHYHHRPYSSQSRAYHAHPVPRSSPASSRLSHYSDSSAAATTTGPSTIHRHHHTSSAGNPYASHVSQQQQQQISAGQASAIPTAAAQAQPSTAQMAHQGSLASSTSSASSGSGMLPQPYLASGVINSDSPISPILSQTSSHLMRPQSGRQLPQRPFKQSISIDQHSLASGGVGGNGMSYNQQPSANKVPASSPAHRNLASELDQVANYPQQQQSQGYVTAGHHAHQRFNPQHHSSSVQYGSTGHVRNLRLEMEFMEKQAANLNLYDPATSENPAARLPPSGSTNRQMSASATRQLPTICANQSQGLIGSMSLDQTNHHHQVDPFQQQHHHQQQSHLHQRQRTAHQDPNAATPTHQQLHHHPHHPHQLVSASTDWHLPVGMSHQQHQMQRSAGGQFKQAVSIDHYTASPNHHQHYAPPSNYGAEQYQLDGYQSTGPQSSVGYDAYYPASSNKRDQTKVQENYYLSKHQQPLIDSTHQMQQQSVPSDYSGVAGRSGSNNSSNSLQNQAGRPILHHQISSSSSNSNQSSPQKSSQADSYLDKQQIAGALGHNKTYSHVSNPLGTIGYQHSPQHHTTATGRPDMLRRGYTSLAMTSDFGSDLGGSQTALSESGDFSITQTNNAHSGQISSLNNRRSGLRTASPSVTQEAPTPSGSGQHHRDQHHSTSSCHGGRDSSGLRSESSTGLPNGASENSTLTKKSNSATQLSMTGTKKRLGFRKKQVTSFSVHRSEEVAPLEARHLVKQGSSVSEGDSSVSGDSSSRSWSNSNFRQQNSEELASMSFIDGLGKGQMISRQGLASPYLGDIQLSLCDRRGNLEIEVIRARNLQAKTTKVLPLTYVKLYLVKNRKCLAKAKTTLSNKRTLNPLFQQQLTFHEDYHGCILQSIVWGNFGKMDKKNFMGIAQISIDDLELSDTVISWYKLFLPSSLQTLPSKSLRHTLLSNSTESFTNTNNS